ncbi:alpha/beta hydrolase [Nocardia sp. NPDC004278]
MPRTLPRPNGAQRLDRHAWGTALDRTVSDITGEVVLVAHSAGVLALSRNGLVSRVFQASCKGARMDRPGLGVADTGGRTVREYR